MRFSYLKSITNFLGLKNCLKKTSWNFLDFLLPTSLQHSKSLRLLMEPLERDKIIYEKIELGLHEALINAAKHGNLNDKSKVIRVRRIITSNWFVWQIKDEGTGTPYNLRSPILPDDLGAESGRGLYIIYQCFDDVRWSKKGNRIQLASKRS